MEHRLNNMLWHFIVSFLQGNCTRDGGELLELCQTNSRSETATLANTTNRTTKSSAPRFPASPAKTSPIKRLFGGNWALLGDAAGFADPVTGEGIYYALRSAEVFAEAYLSGQPQAYEARWREDFGADLSRAAQMRRRFYGNFWGAPFTERMIEFAPRPSRRKARVGRPGGW